MYALRNKVQLIGNLGNAPEIKTLEGGKKLRTIEVGRNQRININVSGLPAGQYTIIFRSKNGQMVFMPFVHF